MTSDNCIKVKMLYKFNKIKWSHLPNIDDKSLQIIRNYYVTILKY